MAVPKLPSLLAEQLCRSSRFLQLLLVAGTSLLTSLAGQQGARSSGEDSRVAERGQAPNAGRQFARGRALVVLETATGKPWVDATVSAVSWPLAELDVGSVDRVQAKSDSRGRARLALIEGRSYSLWASDVTAGRVRVSRLVLDVMAGMRPSLTMSTQPLRSISLRATLGDHVGEISWWVASVREPRLRAKLELDSAGLATLPALPRPLELRAVARDGRQHLRVELATTGAPQVDVVLPRLPRLLCKVGYDGAGLSDASVLQKQDGRWVRIGKTGVHGIATCDPLFTFFPSLGRYGLNALLRSRSKFDADAGQRVSLTMPPARDPRTFTADYADVVISSTPGYDLAGRVAWSDGRPARRLQLLLMTPLSSGRKRGFYWGGETAPQRCGDAGGFVARGVPRFADWRVFAVPSDSELDRLGRSREFPWMLPLFLASGYAAPDGEIGPVVVDEDCCILDVRVQHQDGSPVRYPTFAFGRGRASKNLRLAVGNKAGRGRLMLPRRPGMTFGVGASGAAVAVRLDLTNRETVITKITMPALAQIRGRVVDSRGQPIAAATVHAHIAGARGGAKMFGRGAAEPGTVVHDRSIQKSSIQPLQVKCRSDGTFSLRLGPGNAFKVWAQHGRAEGLRWSRASVLQVPGPGEESLGIVIMRLTESR